MRISLPVPTPVTQAPPCPCQLQSASPPPALLSSLPAAPRRHVSPIPSHSTDLVAAADDDELTGFQTVDELLTIDEGDTGSLSTALVYTNALRGYFARIVVDEGHNIKVGGSAAVVKPAWFTDHLCRVPPPGCTEAS